MKIIKDKSLLKRVSEKVTMKEGKRIGKKLLEVLKDKGGIGLAANQVGIFKRVCVVDCLDDSEPKILINPEIVWQSEAQVGYVESCLSLPNKRVKTVRFKEIKVKCDNWVNEMSFMSDAAELDKDTYWSDQGFLECICVQHEIDHLNGKLITDKDVRFYEEPLRIKKFGRNDKIMIKKDEETQYIKYKKALPLLNDGWEII